ncbi:MAG: MBL fold metallo-hydrolase [Thermoanaerobaculia bacterium]
MQRRLTFDGAQGLRLCVLGSGSGGNAVVLEAGGHRLLLDAGFSCREIERRLKAVGCSLEGFEGLVVTHEHGDHIRGVEVFARRHGLTVYGTRGTFEGARWLRQAPPLVHLTSGEPREVGAFVVEPFRLPHDAREPIGVVVEAPGGARVGLVADLGTRSQLAWARLQDLDVLLLETNHDLTMLREGPYPWPLKERVAGRHGHLSNAQAADGLPELLSDRLRHVVLYHLSRTNNLPALAQAEIGEVLAREGSPAEMVVSHQFEPTPWLEIPA